MTQEIDGCLHEIRAALKTSKYALARAVCFRHKNSSQLEVEKGAIEECEQALAKLDALLAAEKEIADRDEINNDRHISGNRELSAVGAMGFIKSTLDRNALLTRAAKEKSDE
jgi:hypothetical protein